MKAKWIKSSGKGFVIRETSGLFIDSNGGRFNYYELSVISRFFENEYKAAEYAITMKLRDYKIFEFDFIVKYREVE